RQVQLQSQNPFFQFSRFEAFYSRGGLLLELALPALENILDKDQLRKAPNPALNEQPLDVGIPEFAQGLQPALQNTPRFLGHSAGRDAAHNQELGEQPS